MDALGGPGASKGQIIDIMCREFGFTPISLEDIVFACAKNKMQSSTLKSHNATPTTAEVFTYLSNHPDDVTMVRSSLLIIYVYISASGANSVL